MASSMGTSYYRYGRGRGQPWRGQNQGPFRVWRPKTILAAADNSEPNANHMLAPEAAAAEGGSLAALQPVSLTAASMENGLSKGARVMEWLAPGGEAQQCLVQNGCATLPGIISETERLSLLRLIHQNLQGIADWKMYKDGMRPRTINMKNLRFGEGAYTYLREPLPEPLHELRNALYAALVPLANSDLLRHRSHITPKPFSVNEYPHNLEAFHDLCRDANPSQTIPKCLVLQYKSGGHNLPHRDIYGCVSFPYQALCVLTVPGQDFGGGEFYTQPERRADEQRQHIPLSAGDLLVFQSSRWHGSEYVSWGRRVALGLQFHLAQT